MWRSVLDVAVDRWIEHKAERPLTAFLHDALDTLSHLLADARVQPL